MKTEDFEVKAYPEMWAGLDMDVARFDKSRLMLGEVYRKIEITADGQAAAGGCTVRITGKNRGLPAVLLADRCGQTLQSCPPMAPACAAHDHSSPSPSAGAEPGSASG